MFLFFFRILASSTIIKGFNRRKNGRPKINLCNFRFVFF